MIQPVPKSHKEEKSISRQVNLAIILPPVTTEYLHWSEQPIEFNREDHPITVPWPGNAPLVLKAQIGGYDVEREFMDAGSGINLIYAKNASSNAYIIRVPQANRLFLPWNLPGRTNYPLGRIALDICFCNRQNYRKERLDAVGMTIWVGQRQSRLPANVPGIAVTSGQGGRLRPRSRLRQQPADITTEGLSRRRRQNL
jgi:hypothetical protein